jgi:hypothetical protein
MKNNSVLDKLGSLRILVLQGHFNDVQLERLNYELEAFVEIGRSARIKAHCAWMDDNPEKVRKALGDSKDWDFSGNDE